MKNEYYENYTHVDQKVIRDSNKEIIQKGRKVVIVRNTIIKKIDTFVKEEDEE